MTWLKYYNVLKKDTLKRAEMLFVLKLSTGQFMENKTK